MVNILNQINKVRNIKILRARWEYKIPLFILGTFLLSKCMLYFIQQLRILIALYNVIFCVYMTKCRSIRYMISQRTDFLFPKSELKKEHRSRCSLFLPDFSYSLNRLVQSKLRLLELSSALLPPAALNRPVRMSVRLNPLVPVVV